MGAGALDDISILDFSRVLAGPLASMVLADLGAAVTKVERPPTGDETRSWSPPVDPSGESTYFQAVNRNKTSVMLDLSDPRDRRRASQLVDSADVIVENFRPGVMESFGLGWHEVHARHPRLVYCSITGFGAGAGATLPGYDLLVQAVGGLMSITGPLDGEPYKVGVAVGDVIAGLFAAVGVLAALHHRNATGEGQRVEIDLLSSLLAGLANQSSAYTAGGVVARRLGNAHPSIAPYELFKTRTDPVAIAVGNDRQFHSLCEVIGERSLARDRRFRTNSDRVSHRDELRTALEARLIARSADDWIAALRRARVPAGPVNDIDGAFRFATELGLAPVISIDRADGTTVRLPRNPITLSATPPSYRLAPPRFPQS